MSVIRVDCAAGRLTFGELAMDCTIGRGGARLAADKREGDGCTPVGLWPIRGVLLRQGRVESSDIHLPWRWIWVRAVLPQVVIARWHTVVRHAARRWSV